MSGKISSRGPTQSQMANLDKHYNAYTGALAKKADLQKQLQETREIAENARQNRDASLQAKAECLVSMENSKAKLAQLEQAETELLAKMEDIAAEKLIIQNTRAQIKASNATIIATATGHLSKMETALKKMKNSEVLLLKTASLMTQLETLKASNEKGDPVSKELEVFQTKTMKDLALEFQSLAKSNAAAKK